MELVPGGVQRRPYGEYTGWHRHASSEESHEHARCGEIAPNVNALGGSWMDYWWILASLAYVARLVFVVRRGTWETLKPFLLVTICVFILCLPFEHPPLSYVNAVLTVVNLLLFVQGCDRARGRTGAAPL